ncbi:MAG: SLC13 family permease [Phycisphaerales bacterium]|nr:SLC13 family permease [Phycisphaerales bacterium]
MMQTALSTDPISVQGWLALAITLISLTLIVRGRWSLDLVMAGTIGLLVLSGVLSPSDALSGIASPAILTIPLLLIVSQGVIGTGLVQAVGASIFGRTTSERGALLRLTLPLAAGSAFLNNTPLVAMSIPVVHDFCRRTGLRPSRLLMPIAFAASLGGMCTLIGTSTNLVVADMWAKSGHAPLHLFDLAPVGIPAAIAGLVFLILAAPKLLPAARSPGLLETDPRGYSIEMLVEAGSPLVGQSVDEAGLRGLRGLFLAEIERNGVALATDSSTRLVGGDRLVFVGVVAKVVELQQIRGLRIATDQVFKLESPSHHRFLVEAIISRASPAVGQSIRSAGFRGRYGAVVLAVSRGGTRIEGMKLGDIELEEGDALLLLTQGNFMDRFHDARDFLLVRKVDDSTPLRRERAWISALVLLFVVAVATIGPFGFGMFEAALMGAGLMLLTRCTTGPEARKAANPRLVLIIAGAVALGLALDQTGIAQRAATSIVALAGDSRLTVLIAVFAMTWMLTEILSNATAAALAIPIALAAATQSGIDPQHMALLVMVAASTSFATPFGYQTNLMVQEPGGYKFGDYMRLGLPLAVVVGTASITAVYFL